MPSFMGRNLRLSLETFLQSAHASVPQLILNASTWGNIGAMTSNFKKSQFEKIYEFKISKV